MNYHAADAASTAMRAGSALFRRRGSRRARPLNMHRFPPYTEVFINNERR